MAAGSTRQRSKSDCLPGNVWVREESQTLRPSARKVALGTTESIAPAPKSSGSSTAEPPAGSSVITGTFLNGQRTSRSRPHHVFATDPWLASGCAITANGRTGSRAHRLDGSESLRGRRVAAGEARWARSPHVAQASFSRESRQRRDPRFRVDDQ